MTLLLKDRGCWWQKPPPTGQSCRQNISYPTFVTNIDVDRSLDPFASLMQHHPYGLKGLYGLKGQMKTVYPICLTSFHLEIFQWVHSTSAQVEQARVLLNFVVPTKHITRKTFYDDKNVCSSLSIG